MQKKEREEVKDSHKRLLQQSADMAEEGMFGESIKAAREEYSQLPVGIATLLKCSVDAYKSKDGVNDDVRRMRDLFTQLIIATYRDAARVDQEVAVALMHSMIADYPGVSESCLAPQFCSLMQAALGFRELARSTNRSLLCQQMSRLVLAYNEFLNALLGFMIPCLRCVNGQKPDPTVFGMPYRSRLDQINALTGGEEGAFYLITRLGRPRIKNAIAHCTIWLDADAAKVHYTDGSRKRREYQIDLMEFGALARSGSHLGEPYLAAIGTIAVMEDGSDFARGLLPDHLVRLFRFTKEKT